MRTVSTVDMRVEALCYSLVHNTNCESAQNETVMENIETTAWCLEYKYDDMSREIIGKLQETYPDGISFRIDYDLKGASPVIIPKEGAEIPLKFAFRGKTLCSQTVAFMDILDAFPPEFAENCRAIEKPAMEDRQVFAEMMHAFCRNLPKCDSDALFRLLLPGEDFFCLHGRDFFTYNFFETIPCEQLTPTEITLPGVYSEFEDTAVIHLHTDGFPLFGLKADLKAMNKQPEIIFKADLLSTGIPKVKLNSRL